jgi:hypothetical protein
MSIKVQFKTKPQPDSEGKLFFYLKTTIVRDDIVEGRENYDLFPLLCLRTIHKRYGMTEQKGRRKKFFLENLPDGISISDGFLRTVTIELPKLDWKLS